MGISVFLAYCFESIGGIPNYNEEYHKQAIINGLVGTRFKLMVVPEQYSTVWYIVLVAFTDIDRDDMSPEQFADAFRKQMDVPPPTDREIEQVCKLFSELHQCQHVEEHMSDLHIRPILYDASDRTGVQVFKEDGTASDPWTMWPSRRT